MNAISLITKYSTQAWDKVYKAESRSSILDGEKDLMKFTGVKTVKIAKPAVSGLSDYHRPNGSHEGVHGGDGHDTSMAVGGGYGYQQGDVSLVWEEFTINCDRAVQLRIELFDDEETDGLAVAVATTEVSRTQVIPEVDAYVFSKLAQFAGTVSSSSITMSSTLGYNENGPIQALNDAFMALAEAQVPEEDQVIFCSNSFYNKLRSTNELVRKLDQSEYSKDIKFTIGEYEGRKIIPVPSSRFKTDIKLLQGGYGFGSSSKAIDFIVCAKNAVYHPVKYDKVRVFSPAVVQDYDGYKVNVRIYHDCFVPDNKRPAIYCHVSGDAAASSVRVLTNVASSVSSKKLTITSASLNAGEMISGLLVSTSSLAIGDPIPESPIIVSVGVETASALSDGTYKIYGFDKGMIVTAPGKDASTPANDWSVTIS
jgi:hypothetical protein